MTCGLTQNIVVYNIIEISAEKPRDCGENDFFYCFLVHQRCHATCGLKSAVYVLGSEERW